MTQLYQASLCNANICSFFSSLLVPEPERRRRRAHAFEPVYMDRYEYRSITFPISHPSDDPLNELARDGWRAISTARLDDDRIWILFERRLVEPKND